MFYKQPLQGFLTHRRYWSLGRPQFFWLSPTLVLYSKSTSASTTVHGLLNVIYRKWIDPAKWKPTIATNEFYNKSITG